MRFTRSLLARRQCKRAARQARAEVGGARGGSKFYVDESATGGGYSFRASV